MDDNKEVVEVVEEAPVEAEKLSLRDALEVAIEAHAPEEPVAEEVAPEPAIEPEPVKAKEYDGPAEFSKEEREYWSQISDEKLKEPILRLHKSRQARLTEIQQGLAEYKHLRDLSETVTPFIKALGVKHPPAVAIQKAVALWDKFENGDPSQVYLAVLKEKGIDPRSFLEEKKDIDSTLSPVLEKVNVLEQKLTQQEQQQKAAVLNSYWNSFASVTNGAGAPKYADIVGNDEKAMRISSQIGSLVGGETELSKSFIAHAQASDPDLTPIKLLERAYLYAGGQITDAPASKSENPQEHLKKSNRAAASVAGRGSSGLASGGVKKFKSTREAAAHALQLINGKT